MKLGTLKPLLIIGLLLIISIYLNMVQFANNEKLESSLKSCLEVKTKCETTYQEEIKKYNDSQIRASDTVKKLQQVKVVESFEDCLSMPIPADYLRVYRGEDSSDKSR